MIAEKIIDCEEPDFPRIPRFIAKYEIVGAEVIVKFCCRHKMNFCIMPFYGWSNFAWLTTAECLFCYSNLEHCVAVRIWWDFIPLCEECIYDKYNGPIYKTNGKTNNEVSMKLWYPEQFSGITLDHDNCTYYVKTFQTIDFLYKKSLNDIIQMFNGGKSCCPDFGLCQCLGQKISAIIKYELEIKFLLRSLVGGDIAGEIMNFWLPASSELWMSVQQLHIKYKKDICFAARKRYNFNVCKCGSTKSMSCPRCKLTNYCSRECRDSDWGENNSYCNC